MEAYCLFGFIVCIVFMMIFNMKLEIRVNDLNRKIDRVYNDLSSCYWKSYNDQKTLESRILKLEKAMNKNRSRKGK